jgi:hypothetical protein
MRSTLVLRPVTWRQRLSWLVAVLLACGSLGWPGAAPAARAADETLDQALRRHAGDLVGYLRAKKYHNVGVLKFRVQKGDGERSDNAGPLNLNMARRLEVALVLANPDESLGIIQDASAALVKADNARANHLTREGRLACFDTLYPLAWGARQSVRADAFLTGCVHLSADRSTTEVTFLGFDRGGELVKLGKPFRVSTDARTLFEAGESYRLSDEVVRKTFFDRDEVNLVRTAAHEAAEVKVGEDKFPLPNGRAPVELIIRYAGQPQPYTVRDGTAFVPEPGQGQQITFVLRNHTREKRGAVLMVNGESTVFREKGEPARCTKWILDPGEEYVVPGYQLDTRQFVPFQVLSPEESAQDEVNYKEHAGTFTLAVFRPRQFPADLPPDTGPAPGPAGGAPGTSVAGGKPAGDVPAKVRPAGGPEDEAREVDVIATKGIGSLPSRPGTLEALKEQLRARGNSGDGTIAKGMVRPGQETRAGVVKVVDFVADPTPIFLTTIRYYQPKAH